MRVAIVTGGTRGIGAAISKALDRAGYHVTAVYGRNTEVAEAFAKENGINIAQVDVSDFDSCQYFCQNLLSSTQHIDVLVNNAGITMDGFLHKMNPENWNSVINTNLNSCFNMTRAVIGSMRNNGFGRIINVSSVNAQKGQAGQTNYAAAKAGIIGFTKALALENASKGITVNAIAPGYIDTEMVRAIPNSVLEKIIETIPASRLGTAEEVAKGILFLCDETSSYITGAVLNLNGGLYMG